jgi:hypothetical protein
VQARGVKVTGQFVECDWNLRRRVWPVDAGDDSTPSGLVTYLLDGKNDRRWRRDVTDDNEPCPIGGRSENRVNYLLGRFEIRRKRRGYRLGSAGRLARAPPNSLHSAIFMIGQQDLIAWLKRNRGGHDIHSCSRVLDKHKIIGRRPYEARQVRSGIEPCGFELPHEKIHRLARHPLLPLELALSHDARRRSE